MKRKILLAGLFLCTFFSVKSQLYDFPSPGSKALGMSGASDTTVWSLFSNPAGLASVRKPAAGIGYHNAFLTNALASQSGFGVFPSSLLNVGGAYSRYGSELYNVQSFSVSLSRRVAPVLSMGLRFGYFLRSIKYSESAGAFAFDAGVMVKTSECVLLSVYSCNPAAQVIINDDDQSRQPLPSLLAFSCSVKLSPVFMVTADLNHRNDLARQIYGLGMSASIQRWIELRTGIVARPVRLSFGTTLRWDSLELTMAANHHDRLGLSSTAGLVWYFSETKGGHK